MKINRCLIIILLLISGIGQITINAKNTKTVNLIKNGGFELDATKWELGKPPKCWSFMWGRKEKISLDNDVKYSGEYSLKISGTGSGSASICQYIKVKPGERYNLSCYVKTQLEAGGCGFSVRWLDAQGKYVMRKAFAKEKGKPWAKSGKVQITHNANTYGIRDWTKVELKALMVPETAVKAMIGISTISFSKFKKESAFWVDDVVMKAVNTEVATAMKSKSLITIGKINKPLVIDGNLTDAVWKNAAQATSFTIPKLKALANKQTIVRLAYDDRALYLGIRCEEPSPDKLKMFIKQHDGAIYDDDCVEIFLAPWGAKAGNKQFQFLVNPAGICNDISEVWGQEGSCTLNDKWNPNCKIATTIEKDAWIIEMEIPFSELGVKSPADLDAWGFNVIRNRRSAEIEQSSWSMAMAAFQNPKGFGIIRFTDKAAGINSCIITRQKTSFLITNYSDQDSSVTVRVEQKNGKLLYPLGEKTIILAPKQTREVTLSIAKPVVGVLWASVSSYGKEIFRKGYVPGSSYAAIGWFDPDNILGDKLYVASDLRSFKCFSTTHNFKNATANGFIERKQKPVDLYFELPKEIKATALVMFVNNWKWWQPVVPIKKTPFKLGNKEYIRYKFELPAIMNFSEHTTAVFFETSLPAGEKRDGTCYLKWKGGEGIRQHLSIETIKIGRTPLLKKFVNNIYYAPPEFLLTWLPELGKTLPQLGLNLVEISPNPTRKYSGPKGMPSSRREWFNRLVEEADKGKMFISTLLSESTPYWQGWTTFSNCDPEARAIDIKGQTVIGGWSSYLLCPLYRGRRFQKYINMLKNSIAFQKYKISWLALDLELWNEKEWNTICYCKRCLDAAKKYTSEKYPKIKLRDPRKFMLKPENHSKQVQIWREFKAWTRKKFVADIRKPIEKLVLKQCRQTSPKPGLTASDWCWPTQRLFQSIDYFETNLYFKPATVAKRLGMYMKLAKGKKIVIGTPSTGQTPQCPDSNLTIQEMRYNIFECAAAGVQGMRWYYILYFDALKLKTMVDGIRTIQPFENIILDGKYLAKLPCKSKNKRASARGMKLDTESLVIVRSYEGKEKVEAKVTLPCTKKSVVYDCYTRKVLGTITPDHNQIIISITTERARLLYIGPNAEAQKRINIRINK